MIDAGYHHLGREELGTQDEKGRRPANPNWPEVSPKPSAERLDVQFTSKANSNEWTVAIRQRDVTERCLLSINKKQIAPMKQNGEPDIFFYALPAGTLKDGENILSIVPSRSTDNMVMGPIHLYEQPVRDLQRLQKVIVTVTDTATGKPVPARITITDTEGTPVEIFHAASTHTAVRLGTLYTLGKEAGLELPPGEYIFCATRGMEWSRGEMKVKLTDNRKPAGERPSADRSTTPDTRPTRVALLIRREVDTTGFVSADTHLHTLTHSGHGDSNLEERMITLAGDGVELAIATDHNHNTDYLPHQTKLALNEYFTAVTGNEVSTSIGHVNGFPLDSKDSPPSSKAENWVQLVDGIRAKGAKVVILNHPRGNVFSRYVYTPFGLNRASGEFAKSASFPFDAVEITNPGGAFDAIYLLRDWFALLNHGEKVTAVSASDTHTVGDPAGWWRSYVASATDDPAKIDVDDACNRFVAGESSIAVGIFSDIRVNDRYRMGQTCSPAPREVNVNLRVAAPSWVTPRRALVFVNGQQVAEKAVPHAKNAPTDVWISFTVPLPNYDAHLVCAVIGDGVEHPSVGNKGKNTAFTLAATNPIYFDVDGNGKYESPRETARALLAGAGSGLDQQWKAIMAADEVVAVQMISLLRQQTAASERSPLDQRIREAAKRRPLIAEYAQYALPLENAKDAGAR